MAYRVAIVDDIGADAEFVKGILTDWACDRQIVVQAEIFPSAERFLFRYAEDKNWDILLLDIEMGAMDGVTMAKRVRRDNEAVQIVFITGYSDYIAEGYEVAALHYLMKPVKEELKDKDIVYLYVTGETSPLATWEQMIPSLGGDHYRVSAAQWKKLGSELGLQGVPTYFIVDKSGEVVFTQVGFPGAETMKTQLLKALK